MVHTLLNNILYMLQFFNEVIKPQSDALGEMLNKPYGTKIFNRMEETSPKKELRDSGITFPICTPTVSVRDAINVHNCDPTNVN